MSTGTIGIVGLGLIGGSMARAYTRAGYTVLALDKNKNAFSEAMTADAIAGALTPETVCNCELLLLAIYPQAAIHVLTELAPHLNRHTLVIDLCGTKRKIVTEAAALAAKWGFSYIGGHPMAGTQFSGFANSRHTLFHGAPMVLVPTTNDEDTVARAKSLLAPVGFGSFAITTAAQHDRVIAFTSQLAHVVSNAYVKSPQAQIHHGFSAGSYKDLTRVAWLNEKMWCELFLENRDFLADEIDGIIHALSAYKAALAANDAKTLEALLREGRIAKEQADRNGEEYDDDNC